MKSSFLRNDSYIDCGAIVKANCVVKSTLQEILEANDLKFEVGV